MAQTLADFFDGKVDQQEYVQSVGLEGVFQRWTAVCKTQRFTFTAAPSSLAHSTDPMILTDIDGKSYMITPVSSFTDGSTGTLVMPTEEVKVSRTRLSYHLWNVTVERTGRKFLRNGIVVVQGPSWM